MDMSHEGGRSWAWVRWAGWGGAVALVGAPLVLMKFAPETGFDWTTGDVMLAAVLIGTVGLLAELTVRASSSWPYRLGAAMAVGTGLLLIWSNLAVGYIGDSDAPINGVFLAIPILALVASAAVMARARAMVWIMAATGAAHAVTGMVGFPQDMRTGPITMVFVGMWLASSLLFRKAARDPA